MDSGLSLQNRDPSQAPRCELWGILTTLRWDIFIGFPGHSLKKYLADYRSQVRELTACACASQTLVTERDMDVSLEKEASARIPEDVQTLPSSAGIGDGEG